MPDNTEPNDPGLTDESDPKTAPEVPDFADATELDGQDTQNMEVTSVPSKENAEQPSEEDARTESPEEKESDKDTVVPVDHQLPTEIEAVKPKKKRSKKRLIAYCSFILVNVAILIGTILVLKSPKEISLTVLNPTEPGNNAVDTSKPQETLNYVSDALKLEFDYPSDWRISSNPDNTYITIQSAPFQVTYTTGAQAEVRGFLTIYDKYPESNLDVESRSQIAAASEKLVYKNPTKVQRSETFLSFAHPSIYNNTNIVTAAFISSDLSYSPGQSVGSKNFTKTNPFIIFRLTECKDGCTQPSDLLPVTIDTMQQTTGLITAKEIIKSMRFSE